MQFVQYISVVVDFLDGERVDVGWIINRDLRYKNNCTKTTEYIYYLESSPLEKNNLATTDLNGDVKN